MSGSLPVAGFLLALGAACCYDAGYALQALEARRAPASLALRPGLLVHLFRRPVWLAATGLTVVGWPLQILALVHAPLTLVQPTLALGLLLLLALASRLLGERVGRREVAGALVVIAGVALVAWAAPAGPGVVPRGAGLVVALALLAGVALAPYAFSRLRGSGVVALVVGAGAADGLAAFVAKLVAEDASAGRWAAALAWAIGAGCVAALGVVGEATALQRAAATKVAPAVLALQIVIPVALAPLVGGEAWGATPLGGALLGVAIAVIVAGVVLLAGSRAVSAVIADAETPAAGE